MEGTNAKNDGSEKKSNIWIWAAVVVAVLVVLFFMFRGGDEAGTGKQPGTGNQGTGGQQAGDEISSLDVGGNPDLGVDDLNSLQVSQEEITG